MPIMLLLHSVGGESRREFILTAAIAMLPMLELYSRCQPGRMPVMAA